MNKNLDSRFITNSFTYNDILIEPALYNGRSRREIDLTTNYLGRDFSLPIIAAPMDTVVDSNVCGIMEENGGLAILPRFNKVESEIAEARNNETSYIVLPVGIITPKELDVKIEETKPNAILIEVAHAHQTSVLELSKYILNNYPHIPLMIGNIATISAAKDFIRIGVQNIKVGVGPSPVCKTREITGCGVPQGSAVLEIKKFAESIGSDVRIIADGGIKNSGDIVKALALGADAVMIGSLLACASDAPGDVFYIDNKPYKTYRGMASSDVMKERGINRAAEGITAKVPVRGTLTEIIEELKDGIQSGLSYLGFNSLQELKENRDSITFRLVMPGSYAETMTMNT